MAAPNPAPWNDEAHKARRLRVIKDYPEAKALVNGVAMGKILLPGRNDLRADKTPMNCFIRVIPWKKYSWAMQIVYEFEDYQDE